jgi:transcriptional regulator with XRE-family HTH domain
VQIGARVRGMRLAQGLSQDAMAKQLGLSFQQVQKYERGVNRVAAGRLMEIAKILKTTVPELIGTDGKEIAATAFDHRHFQMAMSFKRLYALSPEAGKHIRSVVDILCNTIEAEQRKKKH